MIIGVIAENCAFLQKSYEKELAHITTHQGPNQLHHLDIVYGAMFNIVVGLRLLLMGQCVQTGS